MQPTSTICACATAPGGALGIIRVSGPDAIAITDLLFSAHNGRPLAQTPAGRVVYGVLHQAGDSNDVIDDVLVSVQKQVFAYLERLESGNYNMDTLREMLQFVQKTLCTKNPETKMLEDTELAIYLQRKLNRPIRVCGMVRNEGEAGGGPFLAYNPDSTISPQILESSQIDMNDPEKRALFEKGTHFTPVDLVCATRDYKNQPFDLKKYVDPATGFISQKSKDGKELKALELPGLWNGAMSDWNTIFVEVPLATFNPVKTVNDLYRPAHLG